MTTALAAVIASPASATSSARTVRPVAMLLLVSAVIAVLSITAFSAVHGVENRFFDGPSQAPAASQTVDRAVLEQQARGRICRTEPVLTDHVVFQYAVADSVDVLALAEAVAAMRAGAGSIQRYCF